MAVGTRMLQRRATEAVWNTSNYILAEGELGVTTDTGIIKIGDGLNGWSNLPNAFDSEYLPLLGKAADSNLLDGMDSSLFAKAEDVPTITQMTDADTVAIATARSEIYGRTFTDATTDITLDPSDIYTIMSVTNNSDTTRRVINIPTTLTANIPIGAFIDILTLGTGLLKIIPAAGITLRGQTVIHTITSMARLRKVGDAEWVALALSHQKLGRLPKMRMYRSIASNYTAGSYIMIPYDQIDATQTYNPANEWFSLDPAGMIASRRIIVNKDGEYQMVANAQMTISNQGFIHIVKATGNNVQGSTLAQASGNSFYHACATTRLTAGESVGAALYNSSVYNDIIDSSGVSGNRTDFTITRIGD